MSTHQSHSKRKADNIRDNHKIKSKIAKEIDTFLYQLLKNPITFNIKSNNIKDYVLPVTYDDYQQFMYKSSEILKEEIKYDFLS